jgi:hypothetical protein
MATTCTSQVTFEVDDHLKPVVLHLGQKQAGTDGGIVLLKAFDDPRRLTATFPSKSVLPADRRASERRSKGFLNRLSGKCHHSSSISERRILGAGPLVPGQWSAVPYLNREGAYS